MKVKRSGHLVECCAPYGLIQLDVFFIFFKLRMNSTENSELLQQKQNTEARDKV